MDEKLPVTKNSNEVSYGQDYEKVDRTLQKVADAAPKENMVRQGPSNLDMMGAMARRLGKIQ